MRSLIAVLLVVAEAQAGPKDFLVYAPELGGTPEQAKPYMDTFLRHLEKSVGWPTGSARGEVASDLEAARQAITKSRPGFALLSPGLYLDLACAKGGPEPIVGVVASGAQAAGMRLHVVVKALELKTIGDLKGRRLTSNHLEQPKFVSRLVFEGQLDAARDFKLLPSPSPTRPLKSVDRGEADGALIDDAQLAHLGSLPFGKALRVIYSSPPLPPFPVVAFPRTVKPTEREAMRKALTAMCASPSGAEVCKSLLINRFEPLTATAYQKEIAHYCRP